MSYTAEIDTVDEEQWQRLLGQFDDASIFQTWTYGSARWGERHLSHAVIRDGGEAIALAQIILLGMPLLGGILAYAIFGPVWQRHGRAPDVGSLAKTMIALREAYAVQRRLCLRLRWWGYDLPDDVRSGRSDRRPLARDPASAQHVYYRSFSFRESATLGHG